MSHPHSEHHSHRAGHGHDHGQGHQHAHAPASFDRAFAIGIGLNMAFVAIEAFYGWTITSLALLADAGYAQYEVSAYAQAGRRCDHNLNYWRYGDYLGIGAGAHGKLTLGSEQDILRRWKHKHPATYMAHAGSAAAIGGEERVALDKRPFEYMLNALRLVDGFTLTEFAARTGLAPTDIAPRVDAACKAGWLERSADRVRPTELGRRFTNDVVGLFLDEAA